jgi:hypothetical protein
MNAALVIMCERQMEAGGDGALSILKAMEGDVQSTFYAILDRTNRLSIHDRLIHTVPIHVFMTGTLHSTPTVVTGGET